MGYAEEGGVGEGALGEAVAAEAEWRRRWGERAREVRAEAARLSAEGTARTRPEGERDRDSGRGRGAVVGRCGCVGVWVCGCVGV